MFTVFCSALVVFVWNTENRPPFLPLMIWLMLHSFKGLAAPSKRRWWAVLVFYKFRCLDLHLMLLNEQGKMDFDIWKFFAHSKIIDRHCDHAGVKSVVIRSCEGQVHNHPQPWKLTWWFELSLRLTYLTGFYFGETWRKEWHVKYIEQWQD